LNDQSDGAEGIVLIIRGAADTDIEQEADQAQLRLSIDRQAVVRYGINVRSV
jgi:Cu/Ag efflux pump CusA